MKLVAIVFATLYVASSVDAVPQRHEMDEAALQADFETRKAARDAHIVAMDAAELAERQEAALQADFERRKAARDAHEAAMNAAEQAERHAFLVAQDKRIIAERNAIREEKERVAEAEGRAAQEIWLAKRVAKAEAAAAKKAAEIQEAAAKKAAEQAVIQEAADEQAANEAIALAATLEWDATLERIREEFRVQFEAEEQRKKKDGCHKGYCWQQCIEDENNYALSKLLKIEWEGQQSWCYTKPGKENGADEYIRCSDRLDCEVEYNADRTNKCYGYCGSV